MTENKSQLSMQPVYITSAVNYTNGPPHIGHAYEAISTDVIARYHRSVGRPVYFLTGTDEHGQKIAKTAKDLGLTPQQLCDKNSDLFKDMDKKLNISYDNFIRTTDEKHKKIAQKVFEKIYENGDIYLGEYTGWYNSREERFVTETEASSTNYVDPVSNLKYEKISESSYFFKLENYRQRLIKHIMNDANFIFDEAHRNDILKRLQDPLRDLSISRTSFDWGIPVQINGQTQDKHVMYVWFDALTNYLSGQHNDEKENNLVWNSYGQPIHIIGQDIIWFHAVIWPCILIAIGCPLPKSIIIHGFINDDENRKMSKSLGNVVDPTDLLQQYNSDIIRYYLIRGGVYGSDFKFSPIYLKEKTNSELADCYGNLVSRVFALIKSKCLSTVPNTPTNESVFDSSLISQIDNYFHNGQISHALEIIIQMVRSINLWLTEKAPWNSKDASQVDLILRQALEKIYIVTHFLYPFIPSSCQVVFDHYNHPKKYLTELSNYNLCPNKIIDCSKFILFEKLK